MKQLRKLWHKLTQPKLIKGKWYVIKGEWNENFQEFIVTDNPIFRFLYKDNEGNIVGDAYIGNNFSVNHLFYILGEQRICNNKKVVRKATKSEIRYALDTVSYMKSKEYKKLILIDGIWRTG